ncbi:hypothetical protein POTOM_036605 [Populus tomentosa]|uniref:GINS subunit domain-containing protein n=1 Tax=Populus tomentosa TaxID=118781 RepID=A0A8X8CN48_POPTO|nr:hypothetical protein POTOM_036605 [Populus tomentosa]
MANYNEIDDILAEEEFVPVVFQKAINGVKIDESTEKGHVEQGSKTELPFWLARELHMRQAVSISVPACFNQNSIVISQETLLKSSMEGFPLLDFRELISLLGVSQINCLLVFLVVVVLTRTRMEIQADAACVDLRSRCPYFYEFGCKLAPLCDKTIGLLLPYAFRIRYKEILHKAHTTAFATASKFLTHLTREETSLYEAAQSSMAAFKKWRMGGPRLQRASILGRKRKPAE